MVYAVVMTRLGAVGAEMVPGTFWREDQGIWAVSWLILGGEAGDREKWRASRHGED